MPYEVKLEIFEGPLDLLLYLIRKNEISITDIPIALITEQYLHYLDMMKSLNLDLAGEFLVMAATLLYIKSRLLLPASTPEEAGEDPRRDLVEQLLSYQAYKEAALALNNRPILGRDTFKRGRSLYDEGGEMVEDLTELNIFDLFDAFRKVLNRFDQLKNGGEKTLEVEQVKMSLADAISDILGLLKNCETLTFDELIRVHSDRMHTILYFLAVLELVKMNLVRVFQSAPFGVIRIFPV